MKEEEEDSMERECVRCGVIYTQKQNKTERKCMQHPGYMINLIDKEIDTVQSVQEAKIDEIQHKKMVEKDNQTKYLFACCLKGLSELGQKAYYHIKEGEEDECEKEREEKMHKWEKVCQKLG